MVLKVASLLKAVANLVLISSRLAVICALLARSSSQQSHPEGVGVGHTGAYEGLADGQYGAGEELTEGHTGADDGDSDGNTGCADKEADKDTDAEGDALELELGLDEPDATTETDAEAEDEGLELDEPDAELEADKEAEELEELEPDDVTDGNTGF